MTCPACGVDEKLLLRPGWYRCRNTMSQEQRRPVISYHAGWSEETVNTERYEWPCATEFTDEVVESAGGVLCPCGREHRDRCSRCRQHLCAQHVRVVDEHVVCAACHIAIARAEEEVAAAERAKADARPARPPVKPAHLYVTSFLRQAPHHEFPGSVQIWERTSRSLYAKRDQKAVWSAKEADRRSWSRAGYQMQAHDLQQRLHVKYAKQDVLVGRGWPKDITFIADRFTYSSQDSSDTEIKAKLVLMQDARVLGCVRELSGRWIVVPHPHFDTPIYASPQFPLTDLEKGWRWRYTEKDMWEDFAEEFWGLARAGGFSLEE